MAFVTEKKNQLEYYFLLRSSWV
jgi:hypothetical protein